MDVHRPETKIRYVNRIEGRAVFIGIQIQGTENAGLEKQSR